MQLKQAKEKLQAHALEAVVAALGTGIPIWLVAAQNHLAPHVLAIGPLWAIRIAALLVAVTCWALAAFFFSRPCLKFVPRLGIYQDRKSGLYYCPSCHAQKRQTPLQEHKHGWLCVIKDCSQFYPNPDYEAPPRPELLKGIRNW